MMSFESMLEQSTEQVTGLSSLPSKGYVVKKDGYESTIDGINGSYDDFTYICRCCIENPTHPHICEKSYLWNVQDLHGKKGHEIAAISHGAMMILASMGISSRQHVGPWSDGYVLQIGGYVLLPDRDRLIALYNHIDRMRRKGLENYDTIFTVRATL